MESLRWMDRTLASGSSLEGETSPWVAGWVEEAYQIIEAMM
jgi:hypothetical protein